MLKKIEAMLVSFMLLCGGSAVAETITLGLTYRNQTAYVIKQPERQLGPQETTREELKYADAQGVKDKLVPMMADDRGREAVRQLALEGYDRVEYEATFTYQGMTTEVEPIKGGLKGGVGGRSLSFHTKAFLVVTGAAVAAVFVANRMAGYDIFDSSVDSLIVVPWFYLGDMMLARCCNQEDPLMDLAQYLGYENGDDALFEEIQRRQEENRRLEARIIEEQEGRGAEELEPLYQPEGQ